MCINDTDLMEDRLNLYEAVNQSQLPTHQLSPGNALLERLVVVLDDPVDGLAEHRLHLCLVQLACASRVQGGGRTGVVWRAGTIFHLRNEV